MPQLHLYVPEKVADHLRKRAQAQGVSVSRLLAEVVLREVGSGWPVDFFSDVVGRWKGKPLTRGPQGKLEVRELL
jgi:hypothetical protein